MSLLAIHVAISLIEIPVGLIMLYGILQGETYGLWTVLFLVLAVLTSLTGFPLEPFGFDPPRAIGILTLVLLAIAVIALYGFALRGPWRWVYVGSAVAALYFDVFVAVFQSFLKIPSVHALAPTQSEPPFAIAQGLFLLIFVALGILAVRRFHPAPTAA
jgi:hypothetical protein